MGVTMYFEETNAVFFYLIGSWGRFPNLGLGWGRTGAFQFVLWQRKYQSKRNRVTNLAGVSIEYIVD